jgi:hypothetical protein
LNFFIFFGLNSVNFRFGVCFFFVTLIYLLIFALFLVFFFYWLAKQLADRREIGDGELHRVIRELQRQYFRPPKDTAWT